MVAVVHEAGVAGRVHRDQLDLLEEQDAPLLQRAVVLGRNAQPHLGLERNLDVAVQPPLR